MQNFSRLQGTAVRLAYVDEVAAALRRDPLTNHLAADLDAANLRLDQAWSQRKLAERQVRRARAEHRVQRVAMSKAVSAVMKIVTIEAHTDGSELERELFPEGLAGARAFTGPAQLELVRALQARLAVSTNEGAEAVRSAWQVRFAVEVDAYAETVQAVSDAEAEQQRRWRAEQDVRVDHARALACADAQVRVLFPTDRQRRKVFDPPGRPRKRGRSEDGSSSAADSAQPHWSADSAH